MDVKEAGCEGVEWIQMAQDRVKLQGVLNTVISLIVPVEQLSNHQLYLHYHR
jgi:hypothetical protein